MNAAISQLAVRVSIPFGRVSPDAPWLITTSLNGPSATRLARETVASSLLVKHERNGELCVYNDGRARPSPEARAFAAGLRASKSNATSPVTHANQQSAIVHHRATPSTPHIPEHWLIRCALRSHETMSDMRARECEILVETRKRETKSQSDRLPLSRPPP